MTHDEKVKALTLGQQTLNEEVEQETAALEHSISSAIRLLEELRGREYVKEYLKNFPLPF